MVSKLNEFTVKLSLNVCVPMGIFDADWSEVMPAKL